MKNATIATSRTRATADDDDLIAYRPLPEEWGDVRSLRAVRRAKAQAAVDGADPSTVEVRPPAPGRARHRRAGRPRGLAPFSTWRALLGAS